MNADFSIDLGRDDPALEVPWNSDDPSVQYYDLKQYPELVLQIPEAVEFPELRSFLTRINSPEFPLATAKCDIWYSQEISPEEEIFSADRKLVSYVDFVFVHEGMCSSLEKHEEFARNLCQLLNHAPEMPATIEIVIRRCYYHRSHFIAEDAGGQVVKPLRRDVEDPQNASQKPEAFKQLTSTGGAARGVPRHEPVKCEDKCESDIGIPENLADDPDAIRAPTSGSPAENLMPSLAANRARPNLSQANLASANIAQSDMPNASLCQADLNPANPGAANSDPANSDPNSANPDPANQGPANQGPASLAREDMGQTNLGERLACEAPSLSFTGFCFTTYVTGFGDADQAPRHQWQIALTLLRHALVQLAVDTERAN
jgi:hypothetical protein